MRENKGTARKEEEMRNKTKRQLIAILLINSSLVAVKNDIGKVRT